MGEQINAGGGLVRNPTAKPEPLLVCYFRGVLPTRFAVILTTVAAAIQRAKLIGR